jgi:predicted aminopeptidase
MIIMHELVRQKIDSMMHWAFVEGYSAGVRRDGIDRAWLTFRQELWTENNSDRLCATTISHPSMVMATLPPPPPPPTPTPL